MTSVLSGELVQPGETLSVDVGYVPEPNYRTINHSVSVVLATNDPNNAHLLLRLSGRIATPVEVSPPAIDFGEVGAGTEARVAFRLLLHEYTGRIPNVTDVTPSHPCLVVTRLEPNDNGNKNEQQYEVLLKISGELADSVSYVEVRTDSFVQPVLEVPVRFTVRYRINTAPPLNVVDFGLLKKGTQAERTVDLTLADSVVSESIVATADKPAITAKVIKGDDNSRKLRIALQTEELSGLLVAHVNLYDSNGMGGRVRIGGVIRP